MFNIEYWLSGAGINIFHIIIVVPLIAYLGMEGVYGNPISPTLGYILVVVAVGMLIAHGYRLADKLGFINKLKTIIG